MLKVLKLSKDTTTAQCAQLVQQAWKTHGVVHLQGLQPEGDIRDYYHEMFSKIGEMKPLAEDARAGSRDNQRTGKIWFEVRYDPTIPNAYRHSANAQPLHTDGSYIPDFPNAGFLACVSMCGDGGETVFLDGPELLEILRRRNPALLAKLQSTVVPHKRSGDFRAAPILRVDNGEVVINWNYYCVDPTAEAQVQAIKEEFFQFLRDEHEVASRLVPVKLVPGEAVIWKDDRLLHGRNSFKPTHTSERFLWKAAVEIRDAA